MMISIPWLIAHFIGLVMMIIVWSDDTPPVIIVPGVFGAIAGCMYAAGTIKMIESLKGSRDDQG